MFGRLEQIVKATDEQAREAGVDVKTAAEIREPLSSSSTETGGIPHPHASMVTKKEACPTAE